MIYETAVSHPHHTLFCVLALANANRDTELLQQAKTMRRSSKMSKSQADNPAEEVFIHFICVCVCVVHFYE
jgi:hypothetical protein